MNNKNKTLKIISIFAVSSFLLVLTTLFINNYFFHYQFKKASLENALNKITERETYLNDFLSSLKNNLIFLKNASMFEKYLQTSNPHELENFFYQFANLHKEFSQLRFIDKNGFEQIRVEQNKSEKNVVIVPSNKLQDKSQMNYFKQSKLKNLEEVWFTKIEFNIENNKKSGDITLRTILPIKGADGKFAGILVINTFLQHFIENLINTASFDMLLFNDNGKIIYSLDKKVKILEDTLAFYYPHNFQQMIEANLLKSNDFVVARFNTAIPQGLHVVLTIKQSHMEKQEYANLIKNALLSLFTFSIFSIVFLLVLRINKNYFNVINCYQKQLLEQSLQTVDTYLIYTKTDLKDKITQVSDGFCNISGYSKEELLGNTHRLIRHSDTPDEVIQDIWNTLKAKKNWSGELKNRKKNGDYYWMKTNIAPEFDENGQHVGYVSLREDITIKKELEISNNYNTKLLEATQEGKIIVDNDFNIIALNTLVSYMFEKATVGINLFELLRACDAKEFVRLEDIFNEMKILLSLQPTIFHTKGKYYNISLKNLNDNNNVIIISDITKIFKEKVFHETVLNTSDSLIVTTNGVDLKSINNKFFETFDFKDFKEFKSKHACVCELFIQKEPNYLMPEKDGIHWLKQLENISKNSTLGVNKACMIDKYGNERIFQVYSSGVVFPNEHDEVVTFSDITILLKNRKLLESQRKHAAMGEMIAMIAHQWRQPLTVLGAINAKLNMLYDLNMLTDAKFKESYMKSKEVIEHLSQTINDFRTYFHSDMIEEKITVLNLLSKSIRLFQITFQENNIELIEEYEDNSENFELNLSVSKFTQVMLNLFKNTLDAMLENNIEKRFIKISVSSVENAINICIEDSAGGISENIIEKIFDPYFSTKALNGTGLGLYMSKMIIEDYFKGNLSVKNSVNGALFNIKIPTN